jgi:hypothetical protein
MLSIPQQKLVFVSSILQSSVKLLDNEGARKQLVPTHLISFMNHQMPRSAYKQDECGNQKAVHCLSSLSNHQLHSPLTRPVPVPVTPPLSPLAPRVAGRALTDPPTKEKEENSLL